MSSPKILAPKPRKAVIHPLRKSPKMDNICKLFPTRTSSSKHFNMTIKVKQDFQSLLLDRYFDKLETVYESDPESKVFDTEDVFERAYKSDPESDIKQTIRAPYQRA